MIAPLAGPGDRPSTRFRSPEAGHAPAAGGADQIPPRASGDSYQAGSRRDQADPAEPGDGSADASAAKAKKTDDGKPAAANAQRGIDGQPLSVGEVQMIRELQARDREVRAHEAAHQSAGGALTGGASYTYQTGPDGKRYAIGGEVSVALSTSRDPRETIARMAQVRASALAPADPSSQDRAVAAAAAAISARAQAELSKLLNAQNAGKPTDGEKTGSRFDATA